jgi:penicillin amidase
VPYRARRIEELLRALPKHSIGSFARIQGDVVSPAARELLSRLVHAKPASAAAADVLKRLAAWDGSMAADRVEPLVLSAWWRELARAVYSDELGSAFRSYWNLRPVFLLNVLAERAGHPQWCDDVRTPAKEPCAQVVAASLEKALADLRQRYGDDIAKWQWGEPHAAHMQHRPFSRVAPLARLFDIRIPTPGDAFTVNVGRSDLSDEAAPFASRHAASLRAIYDLADPQASLFIHSGGQSGNVLSRHYRSFTEAWARGEYVPMTSERSRLEAAGAQRLVLVPRR